MDDRSGRMGTILDRAADDRLHSLGVTPGNPARRSLAQATLMSALCSAPASVCLKLGHGSFFSEENSNWGDIDLIFLLDDSSPYRKSLMLKTPEIFDVSWCGIDHVEAATKLEATRGRSQFAQSIVTSRLLEGDAGKFDRASNAAMTVLQLDPRTTAADYIKRLRVRLTLLLSDALRSRATQKNVICVEMFAVVLELAALSRGEWINSRSYEKNWSADLIALSNDLCESLSVFNMDEGEYYISTVFNELERVGGGLLQWPV